VAGATGAPHRGVGLRVPPLQKDQGGGAVRSVERCIDILDLLATHGRALSLSDISRGVGAPKSTVLTIVRTLVARGLVALDDERKLYRLGLGVARWGGRVSERVDLASLARPHLQRLARETQETATLALTDGRSVYYVERTVGDQPLQYVVPVGVPRPMHGTAGGKVFLAHMSDAERLAFVKQVGLKRYTERTITDPAALERHLRAVKRTGYGVTRAETSADLFGIAAPIVDRAGKAIAAVNLGGPLFRLRRRQDEYVAATVAAAAAISAEIGRIGNVALPASLRVRKEMPAVAE
jgi:DNA-binding IclR family transcriptional regulator